MKDNWADLPQEILLQIFQYLSTEKYELYQDFQYKRNLQQLQLTNKSWGKAAQRLFYENIFFYRSEKQAAIYLQILESPKNKSLSHTVRKISFGQGKFPIGDTLRSLIKICPNITVIAPNSCGCEFNYHGLSELRKEGYLQRLKTVTAPDYFYTSLIPGYEDAMLCLASTVIELCIFNKSLVANHLSDFVSLEKLEIHDYAKPQIPLNDVARVYTDNQLPRLKSFNLILHSNPPSGDYDVSGIRSVSQVEQVALQLDVISAQDLCYIMRMFPEPKRLEIDPFGMLTYLPQVNDDASKHAFDTFSEYISRIPNLQLEMWVMQSEVLLDSISSLATYNTFGFVTMEIYHIGETGRVDLQHVTRSAKKEEICDGEEKAACDLFIALSFEATYHLKLMKALLTNAEIKSLHVNWIEGNLEHGGYDDEDITTVKFGACLDYTLSHCAALKELSLECLEIDSLSNDITTNPFDKLSLTSLTLKLCQVSRDGYGRMSQRIKHVNVFNVQERACDGEFYAPKFEAVEINMPYTTFQQFIYANEWDTFAVKIRSCTKVVTFKVSRGKKIERLNSSSSYVCDFASRSFHTLTVCCHEMSFFSVEGCEAIRV